MVADLDNVGRILDESIVELRDVNKAVLMHTDVYECPEVGHISDNPFQSHPCFDIANRFDSVGKSYRLVLFPRISTGL